MIVTRNRPDELRHTLRTVCEQTQFDHVETVVVDDASDVPLPESLMEEFPGVRFERSQQQQGLIAQRNRVMQNAKTDYVISLDDDSWFEEADGIERLLDLLDANPQVGIVTCRIVTRDTVATSVEPNGPLVRRTASYIGCGHVIRRSILEKTGFYEGRFFRQGEERDLAIRCWNAGFEIWEVDEVTVFHAVSEIGRDLRSIESYALRNDLLTILLRYPWLLVPWHFPRTFASHLVYCARRGWVLPYLRGVAGFLGAASWSVRSRMPVRCATVFRCRKLQAHPEPVSIGVRTAATAETSR